MTKDAGASATGSSPLRGEVIKQRLHWTVPVTQPMLLCSQIQRSGGTLLTRLLDGHPACFTHPFELKWGRPKKWLWPALDLSHAVEPDRLLWQVMESWPARFAAEGYHKYAGQKHDAGHLPRYPFLYDPGLQRQIFAHVVRERPSLSQRDVLNGYLTSLFNGWLDYQNLYREPKRWVAAFIPKLIVTPDGPDRFFADYPDGLLVTLVRHPGEWLASFARHRRAGDTETALSRWIRSAEASVRAQAARPDRVVLLVFEDLVHRSEATMRALCDRMGIAFSDELLEPTYNSMPVLSDSSYTPATGIDASVTDRYRDTLSFEQLDLVARNALPRYCEIRERFGLHA